MVRECVLYDRECIGCGECDRCDLDPEKICDNCKTGVTEKRSKSSESVTLFDFLNSLSPEQQRSALVHLSVKLAGMQGGGADG